MKSHILKFITWVFIFSLKYGLSIPPNYKKIVTSIFDDWFAVQDSFLEKIVCPGGNTTCPSSNPNKEASRSKINLPWHEKRWNVFVTFPETTTSVWVNLRGADYHQAYCNLMDKIDEGFNMMHPTNIVLNGYYIAVVSRKRHRVRVIQKDQDRYLSHFIDSGKQESLDASQLYVCDTKFLDLPPQAIKLSLKGLNMFDNISSIDLSGLNEHLMVALVQTTKAQYEQNGNTIEVILFDDKDVSTNVNDKIFEEISKTVLHPPKLKKFNAVTITSVLNSGIVTGYLKCNMYQCLIKKEIKRVVAQCTETSKDIEQYKNEIYLVWNRATDEYFRATFVDFKKNGDSHDIIVLLIDYGSLLTVDKGFKICRASLLSKALTIIPSQFIRMRLHGIQNTDNPNVVTLLRGYLKPGTVAYVKVMEQATEPSIFSFTVSISKVTCLNKDIKAQMSLSKVN